MRTNMDLDHGYLPDAYGKYAAQEDKYDWGCRRSFPFVIEDLPPFTESIAIFFIDWDSVPVCGFPWIHWCAYVNGQFEDSLEIPDDISRIAPSHLVQGYNSAQHSEPERGVGYVGPCPPNCDHKYTLQVYALDEELLLEGPFWANELLDACRGHVIEEAGKLLPSRC